MRFAKSLTAAYPAAFIALVLVTCVAVLGHKVGAHGIFACKGHGYSAESYLAYCNGRHYGDYDHGAFWFDIESTLADQVRAADVIFLGNSRSQVAFSTPATDDWFSSADARYFLLGFYLGNHLFQRELLAKLAPRPKAYVINLDSFFEAWESPYSKVVLHERDAAQRYERKRAWQHVHEPLCRSAAIVCGSQYVVFRSRETGAWTVSGGAARFEPATTNHAPDQHVVSTEIASGREFLASLPVPPECVIPTIVPTVGANTATALEIAEGLGLTPVVLSIDGLMTFDGSHLDAPSAEIWSRAFFSAAESRLSECLAASAKS